MMIIEPFSEFYWLTVTFRKVKLSSKRSFYANTCSLELDTLKDIHNKINRRNFLKTMGATGLSSVFTGCKGKKGKERSAIEPNVPEEKKETKLQQVPKRELGKTGVKVPCLCMGGTFNFVENQIILRKSLEWGVSFWDTAHDYIGGSSELGIGKFIQENPEVRSKLFIVSKASDAKTVADVEKCLQTSLKRMNTRYIDLYCGVYQLSDPLQLTDELKHWAKSAKDRNLIRSFGFSTHKNMAQCLSAAAKRDWIDAILTSYNFRLIQDTEMQVAVDKCHKAGVGLIAIKTQGHGLRIEKNNKVAEHFLQRGFTEAQAKIKLVLEDKRFSSACVGMGNIAHLILNIAAAMDKTKLTQTDTEAFKKYAQEACTGYCAGCAHICDSALPDVPYISDIMRYLMYYNSYNEQDRARELFAHIPDNVRNNLLNLDYAPVEAFCPQHLPIHKLIDEAVCKLA